MCTRWPWGCTLNMRPNRTCSISPLSPEKFDDDGNPTGEDRIPLAYLESLFGPEVGPALERIKQGRADKQSGKGSDLMDTLISKNFLDLFGPFTNHPREIERIATEPNASR